MNLLTKRPFFKLSGCGLAQVMLTRFEVERVRFDPLVLPVPQALAPTTTAAAFLEEASQLAYDWPSAPPQPPTQLRDEAAAASTASGASPVRSRTH